MFGSFLPGLGWFAPPNLPGRGSRHCHGINMGIFINYRDPRGPTVVNRVRDSKVTLVLNTPNLNVRDNQTGGCLRVK